MAMTIEERFQVRAPIDRVWQYIANPHDVVRCLPGAELTGEEGDRTYLGRVRVRVGPIVATYAGKATIAERSDADHLMRIVAEGLEVAGTGCATMTLTSRLSAAPDGATEVHVSAVVDVVGKAVQFGRGMIENVSRQLFKQFVECARSRLETAEAEMTAEPASVGENTGKPVHALPLFLRALWAMISRLWRRE